jgi:hypothetical protein
VPDELLVARNPDPDSALPFLIRVPLGPHGLVLKARESWPRTSKVYCHRVQDDWSEDLEILERTPVRSCTRRGPAIDLVLDRARENRSQIVVTRARGREMIFWQSPRTAKQARPKVSLPTRRAAGQVLTIVVDSGEKYAYSFKHQQATTVRRRLPAGDYAVELAGTVVAAVERKSLPDLAGSLLSGTLAYALAELSALPRAALVVEDRYSALFKLEHVAGGKVADALAEAQARFPAVSVMFAETRPLAQEWTYRFLGAALQELGAHAESAGPDDLLAVPAGSPGAGAPPAPEPSSDQQVDLPAGIGAPARRALAAAGVVSLDQLSGVREAEVAALHGVGPQAMRVLGAALAERGLAFG